MRTRCMRLLVPHPERKTSTEAVQVGAGAWQDVASDPTGTGDVLLVERADGVATLTLNRPAARNALSSELLSGSGAWPIADADKLDARGRHPDPRPIRPSAPDST